MTWHIAWSWQADERVATIAAVEGGVLVSAGLQLELLEADGRSRWKVDVPFKVHAAVATQGAVGLLAAHGFYLLNTSDGSMVNEGRSAPGGFSDLAPRPGGGWALAGRRGEIHLFSQQGRGIRRVDSGPVRRLVGWLDREHLLWQDPDGDLWCGRLTGDDRKRNGRPVMELVFNACRGSLAVAKQRRWALGGRPTSVRMGHAEPT